MDSSSDKGMSPAAFVVVVTVGLALTQLGNAKTIIEWYRTAQDTNDRITPQANLAFEDDFASEIVVTINR